MKTLTWFSKEDFVSGTVESYKELNECLNHFVGIHYLNPGKDNGRYYGILQKVPKQPCRKSTKIVLNPGVVYSHVNREANSRYLNVLFHNKEIRTDTQKIVLLDKAIQVIGEKIEIPISKLDPGHAMDVYCAPSNPKPKWLKRFERLTEYESKRVVAYFEGFKQGNSGENTGDLVNALIRSSGINIILDRLNIELLARGFDLEELLKSLEEKEK